MRTRLRAVVVVLVLSTVAPSASRAAGADSTGTILVRFRGETAATARAATHRELGGTPAGTVHGLHVTVVRVPEGITPDALALRYARQPGVAWAEPNALVRAAGPPLPNDPLFPQQDALNNVGQDGGVFDADIDAPEGWQAAGMSAPAWMQDGGVPIGIVDSGIDVAHPEFAGRIAACVHTLDSLGTPNPGCADGFGHGTHVAGIAAAAANDATGIAGVSFASPVLVCRALNDRGVGWRSDVAACITWLHEQGARVINLSLVEGDGRAIHAAVKAAHDGGSAAGSVLIAAAGNSGGTGCQYPACFDGVISVGATDPSDGLASFSTQNDDVLVSGPGVGILSAVPGGYVTMNGTSMASPHAAGVAAVIWQLRPSLTGKGVRYALRNRAEDLGPPGRDPGFGFGRVNLCAAVPATCGAA